MYNHCANIKPFFKILLSIIMMEIYGIAFSQPIDIQSNYTYRHYNLRDGLPDMKIRSIYSDNQGFIWMGMLDGFARFDGVNFTFYQPDIQSSNFGIVQDELGQMIFRGSRYNHRLSKNGDSIISVEVSDTLFFNMQNSRFMPYPYCFIENLAGDKKYFAKEINNSFTILSAPDELNYIDNGKVYFDENENLMILPGEEVIVYKTDTKETKAIMGLSAESFVKDKDNRIIALNQDGIYKINLDDATFSRVLEYDFDYNLTALLNNDGALIISDFSNLYRLAGNQLEVIADISLIDDITFDFEGNLWVATYTGLYNFFKLNFKSYVLPDSDVVMSLSEDEDGTLYLATLNGNLIENKGDVFTNIDFPKFGYPIFSFTAGAANVSDRHYFPVPIGLMIKEKDNYRLANIPRGYPRCIHPMKNGNIIFAMKNTGVFECSADGNILKEFSADTLGQNVTDAIYDEMSKRIIVTGSKGINIIDNESIKFIPNTKTTILHVICPDNSGGIWVCGESHLSILQGDSLIAIHTFKNNSLKDLMLADNGWMIVATKLGIALFNPLTYYKTKRFDYLWYDYGNGITGMDTHTFGLFKQRNGTIRMLSSDCMMSFSIDKLVTEVEKPQFHVIFVKNVSDNITFNGNELQNNIELSHNQNKISISYIGLKYSAAHNIRYHYRLKGFEDEWITSKNRQVDYNNLLPGNYTFEIFADAGTDDSQTEIQHVEITIKPAFWQTWWFVTIMIIIGLGLSIGITYLVLKRIYEKRTKKVTLEMQLNALKLKSIRLKSIPHFNANVLAAIEYYVMNMSKEEANRLLNIYAGFTNRTLRDVEKASRSLKDEIEYVTLYLQLEKLRFREKIDYSVDIDSQCDMEMQIPNMILHTYCENAVKHGFDGIKNDFMIKIKAEIIDDSVKISVEDNGMGRKAAAENPKKRSTKQGLDILQRQIEIYNELNKNKIIQNVVDLYDDNGYAAGTRFELIVPNGFEFMI